MSKALFTKYDAPESLGASVRAHSVRAEVHLRHGGDIFTNAVH